MNMPEFLLLAAQVSVLSYYIGVLIYMAPIPVKSVKKWAPTLIEDSIWSMILVSGVTALLYAANIVGSWSGVTLRYVIHYAKIRIYYILVSDLIYRVIVAVTGILAGSAAKVVSFFMLPVVLTFYGIVSAFTTVIILASILVGLKAALAGLGVLLMALPFRLGRNAGASLIAFSVIGTAMLPYLPQWIAFIYSGLIGGYASATPITSYTAVPHFYNLWGVVYGVNDTRPSGGLIEFGGSLGQQSVAYIYKIHADGSYYVLPPLAMPAGRYIVTVEYMGFKLKPVNYNITIPGSARLNYVIEEAPYQLDFRVPNVVFAKPSLLFKLRYCSNISVDVSSDSYTVIECSPSFHYVTLCIARRSGCNIDLNAYNGYIATVVSRSMAWRGIPVKITCYTITKPSNPLYITAYKYGSCRVDWNRLVYSGVASFNEENDSNALIYQFVYLFAVPMVIFSFLGLMGMMIVAFAKLLGATYARVIFTF